MLKIRIKTNENENNQNNNIRLTILSNVINVLLLLIIIGWLAYYLAN